MIHLQSWNELSLTRKKKKWIKTKNKNQCTSPLTHNHKPRHHHLPFAIWYTGGNSSWAEYRETKEQLCNGIKITFLSDGSWIRILFRFNKAGIECQCNNWLLNLYKCVCTMMRSNFPAIINMFFGVSLIYVCPHAFKWCIFRSLDAKQNLSNTTVHQTLRCC